MNVVGEWRILYDGRNISEVLKFCINLTRSTNYRRNISETVFSVLKIVYGEEVRSRRFRNQVKEIKIKLILYNINKSIKNLFVLVIIEDFYRAKKSAKGMQISKRPWNMHPF